jgi:hypothetical protein
MWLLNWLPDWTFHLMMAAGLLGILVGVYFRRLPIIAQYQVPIIIVSVVLTVAGVWYSGGIAKDREYRALVAELQVKIAQAEKQAADANTQIEYVYRDRVQVVEKVRYQVISAIRENTNALDASCRLIPEAVSILNQAAQPPAPKEQP